MASLKLKWAASMYLDYKEWLLSENEQYLPVKPEDVSTKINECTT